MRTRRAAAIVVAVVVAVVAVIAFVTHSFVRAHPALFERASDAARDRRAVLLGRAEGADGIRIHTTQSDRTFAFEWHRGRVLFESHDAAEVRAFLDLIRIDEAASGDHCLCQGGDEVDLLDGGSVLVSFTFTHGGALRSRPLWRGDTALTSASADALSSWFTARGMPTESPRQMRARETRERLARAAAQDSVLGTECAERLRACTSAEAADGLLTDRFPDRTDRIHAAVCIGRDMSGDEDPVDRASTVVAQWLTELPTDDAVAAAFERVLSDPSPDPQALVWLAEFVGPALVPLQVRAAPILLGSSDERQRRAAIRMLGIAAPDPMAIHLLVALLPAADADGAPVAQPTHEQMLVAQELVRCCDLPMLDRLQAVVDGAAEWGEDRKFAKLVEARRDPAGVDLDYDTMDVVPRTQLAGVVRTADGAVVADAEVQFSLPASGPRSGARPDVLVRATTDAAGRFDAPVPVGRRWCVTVVHDLHATLVVRDADLRAATLPAMNLTLLRERTIRGRVLDADGAPAAGAEVRFQRQTPFPSGGGEASVVASDDGSFELPGLDATADEVVVEVHAHAPGADHDERASETQTLRLGPDAPPVVIRLRRAR